MDEIKQTINTLRDSCDALDQINTNLVGAYQQLEQLLTSIEKANELAESWIGLWGNISNEVKPYLNRHNNAIIPPKIQLIAEEQLQKAQRLTTEEDLENVEEQGVEIEIEEIEQSRKNNKRKRKDEEKSNKSESKRGKGNNRKRGRK